MAAFHRNQRRPPLRPPLAAPAYRSGHARNGGRASFGLGGRFEWNLQPTRNPSESGQGPGVQVLEPVLNAACIPRPLTRPPESGRGVWPETSAAALPACVNGVAVTRLKRSSLTAPTSGIKPTGATFVREAYRRCNVIESSIG